MALVSPAPFENFAPNAARKGNSRLHFPPLSQGTRARCAVRRAVYGGSDHDVLDQGELKPISLNSFPRQEERECSENSSQEVAVEIVEVYETPTAQEKS